MTVDLSLIIPTLNERENIDELLRRLNVSLDAHEYEVIFVDDSTDDTPEVIHEAARQYDMPVRVLHRSDAVGGLGGAVLAGVDVARGQWVVVMDADLQHDPAVVPRLVSPELRADADVIVASRYRDDGSAGGLSGGLRRFVSALSTHMSKLLFPRRLSACSDPMSGFFAVRKAALDRSVLRPEGFKILLEILARTPLRVSEIAFTFNERYAGDSNANLREGARFIRQLFRLRLANRKLAFLAIGASGILPNVAVLWILTHLGMHYLPAAVIGTQFGILWNFTGAELLVWSDRLHSRTFTARAWRFLMLGEADLLRLPVLFVLVERLHLGSIPGTLATFALFFVLRFTIADRLIYRLRDPRNTDGLMTTPISRPSAVGGSTV